MIDSLLASDMEPFTATLGGIRANQQEFAAFTERLFAELESRSAELGARQLELAGSQRELEALRAEVRQLVADVHIAGTNGQDNGQGNRAAEIELGELRRRIVEAEHARELARQQALQLEAQLASLKQQLERSEAQRSTLELEYARRQDAAPVSADWVEDLAQARHELVELRKQLLDQPASDGNDQLEVLHAELSELRKQLVEQHSAGGGDQLEGLYAELAESKTNCQAAENELELVRQRASEALASLDEFKRQASAERSAWVAELGRMRKAIELQAAARPGAQADGVHAGSQAAGRNAGAGGEPASADGEADPLIDSVMAQFEMLQKDRQKRRAKAEAK